jgi:hypothetical protein
MAHSQVFSICSAAARWYRKFSVAGGNRFCFSASKLRTTFPPSPETSENGARLVKISFVFRAISFSRTR